MTSTKKIVINGPGATPQLADMTADEETQRASENNAEAKTLAFKNNNWVGCALLVGSVLGTSL